LNAGGNRGRVPGHLTRDQCAEWCRADSRCAGYTFVKSQTSGDNCAVKSSWVESTRRTGMNCCDSQKITTGCTYVNACGVVQTNVDFGGNDLNAGGNRGRVPGHLTRDQCAEWCRADSRCAGYTFVKSQTSGDNCAVKSSWVESTRRTGMNCCDSQKITTGCTFVDKVCHVVGPNFSSDGVQIAGVPWPYYNVLTKEDCQQLCLSHSECNGIHYYGYNDRQTHARGACYVKRLVTKVQSMTDNHDRYASLCAVPYDVYEFVGYGTCVDQHDRTLLEYYNSGSNDCRAECSTRPQCLGYSKWTADVGGNSCKMLLSQDLGAIPGYQKNVPHSYGQGTDLHLAVHHGLTGRDGKYSNNGLRIDKTAVGCPGCVMPWHCFAKV